MGPAIAVGAVVTAVVVNEKENEKREKRAREARRQREALRSSLQNQINSLNSTINLLNSQKSVLTKQLNEIKKYQAKFKDELKNVNGIKLCVILGKTGDGKSTLCNRLYGDNSLKANQGPFKVYGGVHSGTQSILKKISSEISIIDTPGIFDSNNKDKEHILEIINYLKGSPGINCFIIVLNGTDARYDNGKMQMLKQFDNLFGKQFWKHVILVITKIDDLTKNTYQNNVKEFTNVWPSKIRKQFSLNLNEAPLKVISIGIGNVNGINSIKNIIKSHGKLKSDKITFDNVNSIQKQINDTNNRINQTTSQRNETQNRLNTV